jgi:large conductance mechanosensitive channel protein
MLNEFRDFILRGNLVDLAVAVVIGTAFTAVVTSLVETLTTPLIAAIGGEPDFSALSFTINGSEFRYGEFINALLAFLIVATVLFFFVIKPVNALLSGCGRSRRWPRRRDRAPSASARSRSPRGAAPSARRSWPLPANYVLRARRSPARPRHGWACSRTP